MREGAAPLSPVPLYFSSLSLRRTALHYLNAWNKLYTTLLLNCIPSPFIAYFLIISGYSAFKLPITETFSISLEGSSYRESAVNK